jgi:glutaredoxin
MKKILFSLLMLCLCAGAFVATDGREADAARSYSDITVIMYMTDWCPYCTKAREYIKSLGVRLVEYNVERDKDKALESRQKAGRKGVPVIDVEGIIIPGYSPQAIKAAVEERRNK